MVVAADATDVVVVAAPPQAPSKIAAAATMGVARRKRFENMVSPLRMERERAMTTYEGLNPDHAQIHEPIPTRDGALVSVVRQVASSGRPRERTVAAMGDREGDQADQGNAKNTQAEHPVGGDAMVWFLMLNMMTTLIEPDRGGIETVREQHPENGEGG